MIELEDRYMSNDKPVPNRSSKEVRAEETTAAATEIIQAETKSREAKTDRLKAERLAHNKKNSE